MVNRGKFFLLIIVEDIKPDNLGKKMERYLKRRARERRPKIDLVEVGWVTYLRGGGDGSENEKKTGNIWKYFAIFRNISQAFARLAQDLRKTFARHSKSFAIFRKTCARLAQDFRKIFPAERLGNTSQYFAIFRNISQDLRKLSQDNISNVIAPLSS